jgi:hypothetical protein
MNTLQEWIENQHGQEGEGRSYNWIASKLGVSRMTLLTWRKGSAVGPDNIDHVSKITGIRHEDLSGWVREKAE